MEGHYTFLGDLVTQDQNWQKFITAIILGAVLLLVSKLVYNKLSTKEKREQFLVPDKGWSLVGLFDFYVEAFVKFHDSILGPENRRYVSFSGSVFLFFLTSNLLGLVPGMAAITTTVWINVAVALIVLIYFNYHGIRVHGFKNYFLHFCGPIPALAWFMLPLEFLSIIILRPFTLNLRMYWNITADHLVLGIFTDLGPLLGLPFYFLGTFVSFMQAFIFTTLTMIYISLAVQHEDDH